MPSSPRGWFAWSCYVREYQARAHSPRLEYQGFSDRRTHNSRESAISVLTLAERASHSVSGNGIGYALMMQFYQGEAFWYSFTPNEQYILERCIRRFRRELIQAGFLPDPKDGEEVDRAL